MAVVRVYVATPPLLWYIRSIHLSIPIPHEKIRFDIVTNGIYIHENQPQNNNNGSSSSKELGIE